VPRLFLLPETGRISEDTRPRRPRKDDWLVWRATVVEGERTAVLQHQAADIVHGTPWPKPPDAVIRVARRDSRVAVDVEITYVETGEYWRPPPTFTSEGVGRRGQLLAIGEPGAMPVSAPEVTGIAVRARQRVRPQVVPPERMIAWARPVLGTDGDIYEEDALDFPDDLIPAWDDTAPLEHVEITRDIRRLDFAKHVELALAASYFDMWDTDPVSVPSKKKMPPKRGHPRKDDLSGDELYKSVANEWLAQEGRGLSRTEIYTHLAELFGDERGPAKRGRVHSWVTRARKKGFLPPAPQTVRKARRSP